MTLDIGTGDGLFVDQAARRNPGKFYIGVDPSPRPLERVSEGIHRKPEKGGLPNALFVQAAVENLPSDLDGVAGELHVNFPWGSLLRAVAAPDAAALRNLRRVCAPGARLEVVVGIDPDRDRGELGRLGLAAISLERIDADLAPGYRDAGFEIIERRLLAREEWKKLGTAWAKRLSKAPASRTVFHLVARTAHADA